MVDRPTIRDVAQRAGVSKSLVSLVLRGSDQVRPDKRAAVEAAVAELGYRPNAAARSLSERRTRTIGVMLADLRNPWFVDLLDGLNSVLHDRGLRMLMADSRLDRRIGADLTAAFLQLQVDGLVAVGTVDDPAALAEAAKVLPTVVAGTREPAQPWHDVVANDDEAGTRLAVEHLLALGHRRIAHLAGPGIVGALRESAYRAALAEHGLTRPASVTRVDGSEESAYRAAVRLLAAADRPSAVVAFNDVCAIAVMSAAAELGLSVPGDVSVVGYDDTHIARLRHIWLTSVDNANREVGRRAGERLVARLAEPSRPGSLDLSQPRLHIRGTTAPPR